MKKLETWALLLAAVLAFGYLGHGAGPMQTLTLTGTVFDTAGAPAPGVVVVMAPLTGVTRVPAISDSEGKYTLQWRPRPATVDLATTYSVMARDVAHNLATVHAVDQSTTNLDLHLQPGLTISFKVEDSAGNPITNAEARFAVSFGRAGSTITNHLTPTNGDRNRIEFNALPHGYYYGGSVSAFGYGLYPLSVREMETQSNFLELPVVVLRPANLKLGGRVLDEQGKPAVGARVAIFGVGQPTTNTLTDEAGRFLLGACEGPINVTANTAGQPGTSVQTRGGDTNVQLKLVPNLPIIVPMQQQVIPQPRQPGLMPLVMIDGVN